MLKTFDQTCASRRSREREFGGALLAGIIGAGVVGIAAMAIAQRLSMAGRQNSLDQIYAFRDARAIRFQKIMQQRGAAVLDASRASCPNLDACLNNPAGCAAIVVNPGDNICAFNEPSGLLLAGNAAAPLRLDRRGKPCSGPSQTCPFDVIGRFAISGANIQAWSEMSLDPAVANQLPGVPRTLNAAKVTMASIPASSLARCPAGQYVSGFNAAGGGVQCTPIPNNPSPNPAQDYVNAVSGGYLQYPLLPKKHYIWGGRNAFVVCCNLPDGVASGWHSDAEDPPPKTQFYLAPDAFDLSGFQMINVEVDDNNPQAQLNGVPVVVTSEDFTLMPNDDAPTRDFGAFPVPDGVMVPGANILTGQGWDAYGYNCNVSVGLEGDFRSSYWLIN